MLQMTFYFMSHCFFMTSISDITCTEIIQMQYFYTTTMYLKMGKGFLSRVQSCQSLHESAKITKNGALCKPKVVECSQEQKNQQG